MTDFSYRALQGVAANADVIKDGSLEHMSRTLKEDSEDRAYVIVTTQAEALAMKRIPKCNGPRDPLSYYYKNNPVMTRTKALAKIGIPNHEIPRVFYFTIICNVHLL